MDHNLLACITSEMEAISRSMHEMSRTKNTLQRAATLLRTGERPEVIEAMLAAQSITLPFLNLDMEV